MSRPEIKYKELLILAPYREGHGENTEQQHLCNGSQTIFGSRVIGVIFTKWRQYNDDNPARKSGQANYHLHLPRVCTSIYLCFFATV